MSCPSSMMSALCPVPFPPHAGGFLAYPYPRLAVRDNSVAAAAMPLPCVATAVVRTPK